ncbi:MAG: NADH-quinone oxidoreductase subunit H [Rhodopseudomonas palustris]|nr:NADH-quinone oxidoreductase subunit H [Rhodopseudomonas palustris]
MERELPIAVRRARRATAVDGRRPALALALPAASRAAGRARLSRWSGWLQQRPHLRLPDRTASSRCVMLLAGRCGMSVAGTRSPSCSQVAARAVLLAPLLAGLGQPVPRVAAEPQRAARCCCPTARCASCSARTSVVARRRVAAVPHRALRRVRLHGAGRGDRARRSRTDLPFAPAADAIALVGLLRARAGVHRAGGDGHRHRLRHARRAPRDAGRLPRRAGAADGALHRLADLGSRPRSPTIVETLAHQRVRHLPEPRLRRRWPSRWCSLAENARIPVDNPATHLELTMIHEAMMLEYSARHLALIEWAARAEAVHLLLHRHRAVLARGASREASDRVGAAAVALPALVAEARRRRRSCWRCIETRLGQDAHLPRAGVPRHRVPARGAGACSSTCCWRPERMPRTPLDLPAHQPACAALLLLLSFAMLAQRRIVALDQPVRRCRARLLVGSTLLRRLAHRPAPPVLVGGAHARAQGRCCCRWLLHRLIRRLNVQWDVETLHQHPDHDAGRASCWWSSPSTSRCRSRSSRAPSTRGDARHRAGVRAAVVPHDDHAPQGDAAGDRLPVDGERPVLRRHQRHLRHADGGGAGRRARRAGRRCSCSGVFFFQIREQFD